MPKTAEAMRRAIPRRQSEDEKGGNGKPWVLAVGTGPLTGGTLALPYLAQVLAL